MRRLYEDYRAIGTAEGVSESGTSRGNARGVAIAVGSVCNTSRERFKNQRNWFCEAPLNGEWSLFRKMYYAFKPFGSKLSF